MRRAIKGVGWWIILASVCALGAAAEQKRSAEPANGKAAVEWLEIKTPNFTVRTDAGEARGREIAQRFEGMRAAFGVLFDKERVNVGVPLTILAFRNAKDFQKFVPVVNGKPQAISGFFRGAPEQNFIVLDTSVPGSMEMVMHDYAHLLVNGNLPPMPAWYDEGFAEYCISWRASGKQIEFGAARSDLLNMLRGSPWMRLIPLLQVTHQSPEYTQDNHRTLFFAQSWMVVHYLMANHLDKQLATYLDLKENRHLAIEEAIRQAFGVEPRSLESAVRSYFNDGRLGFYRAPAPENFGRADVTIHRMTEAESMTAWAEAQYHSPEHHEEAVELYKRALAQEPDNAAASRGLGFAKLEDNDFDAAQEYFQRAADANADDARVHYLVALLANRRAAVAGRPPQDLARLRRELQTAIRLDPKYGEAYQLLSWVEQTAGDETAARMAIEKAVELNPRNEFYLLTLAQFDLRAQKWEKATPVLQRLQNADSPEVARYASEALRNMTNAQRLESRASVASPHTVLTAPQWQKKNEAAGEKPEEKPPDPTEGVEQPALKVQSIRFLKGELVGVDCSANPTAVLTVASKGKSLVVFTRDRKSLILIGADSFSCNWSGRKVSVNYRMQSDGRGEIVSLEVD